MKESGLAIELPTFVQRRASVRFLLFTGGAVLVALVLMNNLFIPSKIWSLPFALTAGLLHPTFQANVPFLAMLWGLFTWGGVGLRELGLRHEDLPAACGGTLFVWILLQLTSALSLPRLALSSDWQGRAVFLSLGELGGQLLGNALSEEVLWRGFLLVQGLMLFAALGRRDAAASSSGDVVAIRVRQTTWPQLIVAAFFAASMFALFHVPNRIMKGAYATPGDVYRDQWFLMMAGVWFGWFYLRTGNLLLTVGLHSLVNQPSLLWQDAKLSGDAVFAWGTLWGVAWPWWCRWRGRAGAAEAL